MRFAHNCFAPIHQLAKTSDERLKEHKKALVN